MRSNNIGIMGMGVDQHHSAVLIDVDRMKHNNGLETIVAYVDEFKSAGDVSDTYAEIDEQINKAVVFSGLSKGTIVSALNNALTLERIKINVIEAAPIIIKEIKCLKREDIGYQVSAPAKNISSQSWKRRGKNIKSYNR